MPSGSVKVRGMMDQSDAPVVELRGEAEAALANEVDGNLLTTFERAMIRLGLAASVTSLDQNAIEGAVEEAFREGATSRQVQEVVSLVSGLGVHSLMVSATTVLAGARRFGEIVDAPLTVDQQKLWDRYVGDDPFWDSFERRMPGFLEALLRLSADQFAAFFIYCAVPWKSGSVRAQLKELIAMASDATPAHRFRPGFLLHLDNAIALGAGRLAILETLDIAAAAPPHIGVR